MEKTYSQIQNELGFRSVLPVDANWSAAADFLDIISQHCLSQQPGNILECSSGLTTLILARCCQLNGYGHVFSLENGAEFKQATDAMLVEHQLQDYATVLHAPLVDTRIGQESFRWYLVEALPVHNVEMLVVDGPPGFIQKLSRYPAIPVLADRLNKDVVIFLDDAARDDEQTILQRWHNGAGMDYQQLDTDRGCARLWYAAESADA